MKRVVIQMVLIIVVGIGLGFALRPLRNQWARNQLAREPSAEESSIDESSAGMSSPHDPQKTEAAAQASDDGAAPQWISEFTLTERSGETIRSESLIGQPHLVSFFFSTCPSTCVLQNQKLEELQKEFAGQGVKFLSISVDPEFDTPEVLQEYAKRFNADEDQWLFLTGDLTYIRRVAAEKYKLSADRKFHSEKFLLIDREGNIAKAYSWGDPVSFQQLKDHIKSMLSTAST